VEVGEVFGIKKSFLVFVIIIGGLGGIFGSFARRRFVLLPVALKVVGVDWFGWPTDIVAHLNLVVVGALIIIFLIAEPCSLQAAARGGEKLRLWPFPHLGRL
jgi:branched-chain amino acid transport system permease protein